ncbi:tetratricopeptide repeat protein [Fibrobacterota bacterium]
MNTICLFFLSLFLLLPFTGGPGHASERVPITREREDLIDLIKNKYNQIKACDQALLKTDSSFIFAFIKKAEVLVEIAEEVYSLKQNRILLYRRAVENYNQVIRMLPSYTDILYERGKLLGFLGKFESAVQDFRMVIKNQPDLIFAHIWLGSSLYEDGSLDEALHIYENTIKAAPLLSAGYVGKGRVLLDKQRYEEAVTYFNRAIELDPEFKLAHELKTEAMEFIKLEMFIREMEENGFLESTQ